MTPIIKIMIIWSMIRVLSVTALADCVHHGQSAVVRRMNDINLKFGEASGAD